MRKKSFQEQRSRVPRRDIHQRNKGPFLDSVICQQLDGWASAHQLTTVSLAQVQPPQGLTECSQLFPSLTTASYLVSTLCSPTPPQYHSLVPRLIGRKPCSCHTLPSLRCTDLASSSAYHKHLAHATEPTERTNQKTNPGNNKRTKPDINTIRYVSTWSFTSFCTPVIIFKCIISRNTTTT